MMNLIMACSADGIFARGPSDDMRWTGSTDKRVFHSLTSVGGLCGISRRSLLCMPGHGSFSGRMLRPISREPNSGACTLSQFHARCCQVGVGWLLGGPTLAAEALSQHMVHRAFICVVPHTLGDNVTPELRHVGELVLLRLQTRMRIYNRVEFDDELVLQVWGRA